METWKINGVTLEYDDDTHTYIADGVIVPSITQLMKIRFGNKYDFVNEETLQRASERGTFVHETIERYCKTGKKRDCQELRDFIFLERMYKFRAIENEIPVIIFGKDGRAITAGRLDMVTERDGKRGLADIKTTATLDKEYVGYQLNLYRIGYIQCYGSPIDELYGIHLKNGKRKLVPIPISEGFAWALIERYRKEKTNE